MSSRKKLTISLIAVILVVAAAAIAIVSVLAASTQNVKTTFTVSYSAGTNVIADVSGSWKLMATPTGAVSSFSGETIGSKNITSSTSGDQTLGTLTAQTLSATNSLVFKFTFVNKAQDTLNLALTIKTNSTAYTTATLGGKNLVAKYYNGSSWVDVIGQTISVDPNTYAGAGVTKDVYVYVGVKNTDYDVASTSLEFLWNLTAVST